jgi:hypothetical protein
MDILTGVLFFNLILILSTASIWFECRGKLFCPPLSASYALYAQEKEGGGQTLAV